MEATNFMDTVPAVSERAFVLALLNVIHSRLDEEFRDFMANPRPDHPLINLVILVAWVRDHHAEESMPRSGK